VIADADEEPVYEVDFAKTAHRVPILPPPVSPAEQVIIERNKTPNIVKGLVA